MTIEEQLLPVLGQAAGDLDVADQSFATAGNLGQGAVAFSCIAQKDDAVEPGQLHSNVQHENAIVR